MPNENPPRRSIFAEMETGFHALSLYGAAGIVAFGWAIGRFLGAQLTPCLPLWFCAALLIYNLDRLRRDPSDVLNTPHRAAACGRWRPALRVTVTLSALVLIGLPVWRRDWLSLALIISGSIVSLAYSIPVLGWRWKDVPLVKTLFAPTVVTLAVFGLGIMAGQRPEDFLSDETLRSYLLAAAGQIVTLAVWAWCYLLFNMLLCDLRDLAGDAQCGVRSIPVVLGETGTRRLLWVLACTGQVLLVVFLRGHEFAVASVVLLSFLTGAYQAWLLYATRRPRGERFYEWAVEGLLFCPAVAWGLGLLLYRFLLTDR